MAPISAFNCLGLVAGARLCWRLETPSKVLLPPFTGREIVGTKKNNEQRWWAGSPRVFPRSRPALRTPPCCLCSSLRRWRWLSQPESRTKSWITSHHPPEIWLCTRVCVHVPFAGVGRMKQLQFEKLQLLWWSRRRGKKTQRGRKQARYCAAGRGPWCTNTAAQRGEMPFTSFSGSSHRRRILPESPRNGFQT